jgi:hypothetical protein
MKVQSSSQRNNRSWKSSSKTNGIANELDVDWHGKMCMKLTRFYATQGKGIRREHVGICLI